MDHHQQLGQFSILCYHSTISRRPLECVFAALSPAVNGTRATHLVRRSFKAHVGRLDSQAKRKSSGEEPASSLRAPAARTTRANWVNRRGEGGGTGAQLSPWQLRCWHSYYLLISGKYAAIRKRCFILSVQRRSRVRPTHFHLLETLPWRRLSDRQREWAEMLKACTVLLSVPGVPKLFHVPQNRHWLLASEPLCKTDNATISGKEHLRSELIFNF